MTDVSDIAAFTGVTAVISAAHRSRDGVLHGHTWEVKAWWPEGDCALELQSKLKKHLAIFDHAVLGDDCAWGEALGKSIILGLGCSSVEISRPLEGIFARLERKQA